MTRVRKIISIHEKNKMKQAVKKALENQVLPSWIHEKCRLYRHGLIHEDTIMGVLLTDIFYPFEIENFYLADELLKKGIALPLPFNIREHYKTLGDYFEHLVHHPRDLFIALRKHPEILKKTDKNQKTLLDYAAFFCSRVDPNFAQIILHLLKNAPGYKELIYRQRKPTWIHPHVAKYFNGYDVSNFWKLFIDLNRQDKIGPLGFDKSERAAEPGYLRSMFSGFDFVLGTIDQPLTLEYLNQLHKAATKWDVTFIRDERTKGIPTERKAGGGFGLINRGESVNWTVAGIQELFARFEKKDPYYRLETRTIGQKYPKKIDKSNVSEFSIESISKTLELKSESWHFSLVETDMVKVQEQVKQIIEEYYNEIGEIKKLDPCKKDEETIKVIVKCIHELEMAHLFLDGNCRTFAVLLLFKLLLQYGLSPSMIENPNQFDLFSLAELYEKTIEGQDYFNKKKQSDQKQWNTEDSVIYLEGNINLARLMIQTVLNQCPHWHLIPEMEKDMVMNKIASTLATRFVGDKSAQSQISILTKKPDDNNFQDTQQDAESIIKYGGLSDKQLQKLIQKIKYIVDTSIVNKASLIGRLFRSETQFRIDHQKLETGLNKVCKECSLKPFDEEAMSDLAYRYRP